MQKIILQELRKEVAATKIGADLLAFLDDNKIEIRVTDRIPLGDTAVGAYVHDRKILYLRDSLTLPQMLFVLAHEGRHAQQFTHGWAGRALMAFPVGGVFTSLAIESDADMFALYFLFNRCMTLENDTTYFDLMQKPNTFYQGFDFARQDMLHAFYDSYNKRPDETAALRCALDAWLENKDIISLYIAQGLYFWEQTTLVNIQTHAKKPKSKFAMAFCKIVEQREAQKEEQHFCALLRSLSNLSSVKGMPDYLSGVKDEQLISGYSGAVNDNCAPHMKRYSKNEELFENARKHYLGKLNGPPGKRI